MVHHNNHFFTKSHYLSFFFPWFIVEATHSELSVNVNTFQCRLFMLQFLTIGQFKQHSISLRREWEAWFAGFLLCFLKPLQYIYASSHFIHLNLRADPGFPLGGGTNPPGRGTNVWFCQILQKKNLHEIEKMLGHGGAPSLGLLMALPNIFHKVNKWSHHDKYDGT